MKRSFLRIAILLLVFPALCFAGLPEAPPEQLGFDPARLKRIDAGIAKAIEARFTCDLAACLVNCPVPDQVDPSVRATYIKKLTDCFTLADNGGCLPFAEQVAQCETQVQNSSAGFCVTIVHQDGTLDLGGLGSLFTLACGPAPIDAGQGGG